jgi:hypothetical protein
MKRMIEVTERTIIEIEVADDKLDDVSLANFSSYMFRVSTKEEMIKVAAEYVVRHNVDNVEGLGEVAFTEQSYDSSAEIL